MEIYESPSGFVLGSSRGKCPTALLQGKQDYVVLKQIIGMAYSMAESMCETQEGEACPGCTAFDISLIIPLISLIPKCEPERMVESRAV